MSNERLTFDLQELTSILPALDGHDTTNAIRQVGDIVIALNLIAEGFIEEPDVQDKVIDSLNTVVDESSYLYRETRAARKLLKKAVNIARVLKSQRDQMTDNYVQLAEALRDGKLDDPEIAAFLREHRWKIVEQIEQDIANGD